MPIKTNTYIINADNLKYGICEYGAPKGSPLFYFHGYSGSRIDGYIYNFDELGNDLNVRIIAIDRPGIGLTDYRQNSTLLSWPNDVYKVADALKIERFSILGISGGGPYALACAFIMNERLQKVFVISPMGPATYNRSLEGMAMLVPRQARNLRYMMAVGFMLGIKYFRWALKSALKGYLSDADIKYLSHHSREPYLMESVKENFRSGLKGYLNDSEIYGNDWGFKLLDIKREVNLWHGSTDRNVYIETAKHIAAEIPYCNAHWFEGEGHFSVIGKCIKQVIMEVT